MIADDECSTCGLPTFRYFARKVGADYDGCVVCHDGNPTGPVAERRREAERILGYQEAARVRKIGRAERFALALEYPDEFDMKASSLQAAGDSALFSECFGTRSEERHKVEILSLEDISLEVDEDEILRGFEAVEWKLLQQGLAPVAWPEDNKKGVDPRRIDPDPDPVFAKVWRGYLRRVVNGALSSLPDDELDAIYVVVMEEYTVAELAEKQGVAPSTIYRRAQRGLARLRSNQALMAIIEFV